ncbi:hypothetical protein I7I53_06573 [Histoplasma capsulatum var. duboisii H88]|uniref:Secreted protein n=1 Tax=Ajellomyces capsulatus (strain H88) TaxID=544711 RepID=A0A8A1LB42_AJEC8|nr:hypothetical protein I7I53_06573 [Histoplasma capsulatum var. duboisii H88]
MIRLAFLSDCFLCVASTSMSTAKVSDCPPHRRAPRWKHVSRYSCGTNGREDRARHRTELECCTARCVCTQIAELNENRVDMSGPNY